MRLWSIQHRVAYEQLQKTGVLYANEQYLFCEEDFRFAYDWMSEQLELRIGKAPKGVRYPIWAWYQWEGKRQRLDMRYHRRWGEKGTPIVLLTVDVPDHLVLLSEFDLWHCVLNHGPVDCSEDGESFFSEQQMRKSWERIFEWDTIRHANGVPKTTQAVFWELREEWVEKAEFFVSG